MIELEREREKEREFLYPLAKLDQKRKKRNTKFTNKRNESL